MGTKFAPQIVQRLGMRRLGYLSQLPGGGIEQRRVRGHRLLHRRAPVCRLEARQVAHGRRSARHHEAKAVVAREHRLFRGTEQRWCSAAESQATTGGCCRSQMRMQ